MDMSEVKSFNAELSGLYDNKPPISKAKMSAITKGAIKAIKFYKHVVHSVEKFIQKCKPEYKVPGLYVIDSIVRQSRHQFGQDKDVFAPRFAKNMQQTFANLFRCPPEEKRNIIRVLNLWQKNNVFSSQVIQPLLDMADPNHPLHQEIQQQQNSTANGSSLNITHNTSDKLSPMPQQHTPHSSTPMGDQFQEQSSGSSVKFNRKLLNDFEYDSEDDAPPEPAPALPPHNPAAALGSILTNPEIMRQLQSLQAQMQLMTGMQMPNIMPMMSDMQMQQNQNPNLPFLNSQQDPQKQNEHNKDDMANESDIEFVETGPQVIEIPDANDSRSPSPRRRRSRSKSPRGRRRRTRTRSRSPRRRRNRDRDRDRDKEKDKDTKSYNKEKEAEKEKNREREKKGLPPIKKENLSVCSTTLWVGHLSKLATPEELSDLFGGVGGVTSIDVVAPRGCAFVVMERRRDAHKALLKLNKHKLHTKEITVAWAPGRGVKGREWKDYWEAELGVSYLPWSALHARWALNALSLDALEDGGAVDEDTLPPWLPPRILPKTMMDNMSMMPGMMPMGAGVMPPPMGPMPLQPPPQPAMSLGVPRMPPGMPTGLPPGMAPGLPAGLRPPSLPTGVPGLQGEAGLPPTGPMLRFPHGMPPQSIPQPGMVGGFLGGLLGVGGLVGGLPLQLQHTPPPGMQQQHQQHQQQLQQLQPQQPQPPPPRASVGSDDAMDLDTEDHMDPPPLPDQLQALLSKPPPAFNASEPPPGFGASPPPFDATQPPPDDAHAHQNAHDDKKPDRERRDRDRDRRDRDRDRDRRDRRAGDDRRMGDDRRAGDDSRRAGDDSRRAGDDSRRAGDDSRRAGDDSRRAGDERGGRDRGRDRDRERDRDRGRDRRDRDRDRGERDRFAARDNNRDRSKEKSPRSSTEPNPEKSLQERLWEMANGKPAPRTEDKPREEFQEKEESRQEDARPDRPPLLDRPPPQLDGDSESPAPNPGAGWTQLPRMPPPHMAPFRAELRMRGPPRPGMAGPWMEGHSSAGFGPRFNGMGPPFRPPFERPPFEGSMFDGPPRFERPPFNIMPFDGSRPPFDGPRPPFDGLRPPFDGPRPSFDGPRPPFDGPRPPFDGPRPPFDGPRPPFDGPRPPFDGPRPPFDGPRPPFDGPMPPFDGPRQFDGFDGPPEFFDRNNRRFEDREQFNERGGWNGDRDRERDWDRGQRNEWDDRRRDNRRNNRDQEQREDNGFRGRDRNDRRRNFDDRSRPSRDSREGSRDGPREGSRDGPRDGSRDGPKDGSRDGPRDGPRDNPRDGPRDGPREESRHEPREGSRDVSMDGATDGPNDEAREVHRETRKDTANDAPNDVAQDAPKEVSKDPPKEERNSRRDRDRKSRWGAAEETVSQIEPEQYHDNLENLLSLMENAEKAEKAERESSQEQVAQACNDNERNGGGDDQIERIQEHVQESVDEYMAQETRTEDKSYERRDSFAKESHEPHLEEPPVSEPPPEEISTKDVTTDLYDANETIDATFTIPVPVESSVQEPTTANHEDTYEGNENAKSVDMFDEVKEAKETVAEVEPTAESKEAAA